MQVMPGPCCSVVGRSKRDHCEHGTSWLPAASNTCASSAGLHSLTCADAASIIWFAGARLQSARPWGDGREALGTGCCHVITTRGVFA